MKVILAGFVGLLLALGIPLAQAQTGMDAQTHGYGGMYGYAGLWIVYGVIKSAVILFALWLMLRIARAVERIANAKG